MKCKIPYYKNNLIFGDDLEHRIIPSDYKLSQYSISKVYINISKTVPNGTTSLKSVWLWRYHFNNANNTNFWTSGSQYGANGSSVPSGVSTSTMYNCNSESLIPEAYITTGTSNIVKTKLSQIKLSSYNDWYFNTIPSYPSNALYRAILIRFSDNRTFDFPTNFYSLDENNNIIWNTEHYLFSIYKNKEVTFVEI